MTVNPNETHRHAGRIRPYPAVSGRSPLERIHRSPLSSRNTSGLTQIAAVRLGNVLGAGDASKKYAGITLDQQTYTPEEECNCVEIVDILLAHYCQNMSKS